MTMSGSPNEAFPFIILAIWGVMALVGMGLTIFWIVEVVDVARRVFPDQNTKLVWLLVVVLAHGIGALVYYFVGKNQGVLPGQVPPGQNPFPPGPGQFPRGPYAGFPQR